MRADLRSDTLTAPTDSMREAMVRAPVGDDVFGEDPTVAELERTVAQMLGHEAALFLPTGSQANQVGLRLHAGQGDEIIADELAHVLRAELGAAALGGITTRSWPAGRGLLEPEQVRRLMVADGGPYQVSTACVAIENTHNFGGGTVQPLERMQQVHEMCVEAGVAVHLDGARLWNAHVATGVPLARFAACADTVSVCLSKGLGAPVGSVLAGDSGAIARARVFRKRLGGGWRQAGLLAAAGLHALEHHIDRLADDHARCGRVARAVAEVAPEVVDPGVVETNILVLDVGARGRDATDFIAAAEREGVVGLPTGPGLARFVWHLDVDEDHTTLAEQVLPRLLA